jgi:hypothetical protein
MTRNSLLIILLIIYNILVQYFKPYKKEWYVKVEKK